MESFVNRLLESKFRADSIGYEQVAVYHPSVGTTRPDFSISLPARTLLVEVTQAKLVADRDPKCSQRWILEKGRSKLEQYSWMILYIQNCITPGAINFTIACLDALAEGEESLHVQSRVDAWALHNPKVPILSRVPWEELHKSTFGYVEKCHLE